MSESNEREKSEGGGGGRIYSVVMHAWRFSGSAKMSVYDRVGIFPSKNDLM